MEEIKNTVESVVKDRGFSATVAGVVTGLVAKHFSKDFIGSLGAALVAYAIIRRT